jgi:hypothetical protein
VTRLARLARNVCLFLGGVALSLPALAAFGMLPFGW